MSDPLEIGDLELDFDPDEDLFDFDEVTPDESELDRTDLDALLDALERLARSPRPGAARPTPDRPTPPVWADPLPLPVPVPVPERLTLDPLPREEPAGAEPPEPGPASATTEDPFERPPDPGEEPAEHSASSPVEPPPGEAPDPAAPTPAAEATPSGPGAPFPGPDPARFASRPHDPSRLDSLFGPGRHPDLHPQAELDPSPGPRRSVVVPLLVAIACVNALVAIVALRPSPSGERQVQPFRETVEKETWRSPDPEPATTEPVRPAAAAAGEHPILRQVKRDLETGAYDRARERLYAFLAVVDRLEPAARARAEERASYLLARVFHLEACEALEAGR